MHNRTPIVVPHNYRRIAPLASCCSRKRADACRRIAMQHSRAGAVVVILLLAIPTEFTHIRLFC